MCAFVHIFSQVWYFPASFLPEKRIESSSIKLAFLISVGDLCSFAGEKESTTTKKGLRQLRKL